MSPNYFPPDVIERARALRVNPPAGVDDPAIAFACALGRLKFCLRVSKDKEVADMLGIGEKAFNARKKRNSFPEKKLRALAQRRPELGLDVEWVLTGAPGNAIGVVCGGDVQQVQVGCVGAAPVSPAARLRQTASELAAQADAVLVAMDVQPQRPGDRAHVLAAYYLCRGALEVLRAAVQQGDGCGSGVAAADYFTPGVMALARHYRVG